TRAHSWARVLLRDGKLLVCLRVLWARFADGRFAVGVPRGGEGSIPVRLREIERAPPTVAAPRSMYSR
ncbi:MAG: hypothetical protein QNJ89_15480, partial [Acidimicrobiia bacterium]|nr:hypothetical protein [Acidimicrobiia bacterium]